MLSFARIDVTQVGQVCRRAMRVLPLQAGGSGCQKIVIGDESGSVACLGLKKGDLDVSPLPLSRPFHPAAAGRKKCER